MRVSVGSLTVGALLPLLAACGDDGSGPDPLTRADIAGRYNVCQLVFDPEGTDLQSVDIGTLIRDPAAQEPQLRIDQTGEVQLAYTPQGQNVSQDVRGTFTVSGTRVVVDFNQTGTRDATTILLPDPLRLNFQSTPKGLGIDPSPVYNVARAQYAQARGISEANLPPQISGILQADFRTGSCG